MMNNSSQNIAMLAPPSHIHGQVHSLVQHEQDSPNGELRDDQERFQQQSQNSTLHYLLWLLLRTLQMKMRGQWAKPKFKSLHVLSPLMQLPQHHEHCPSRQEIVMIVVVIMLAGKVPQTIQASPFPSPFPSPCPCHFLCSSLVENIPE